MIKIVTAPQGETPEAAGLPEGTRALYIPYTEDKHAQTIAKFLTERYPQTDLLIYNPEPSGDVADAHNTAGAPSLAWVNKQLMRSSIMAVWLDDMPNARVSHEIATILTMGKDLVIGVDRNNRALVEYAAQLTTISDNVIVTGGKIALLESIIFALRPLDPIDKKKRGLFTKYTVYRRDGQDGHGRTHADIYGPGGTGVLLVLDLRRSMAYGAGRIFAKEARADGYPHLGDDVDGILDMYGNP